MAYFVEPPWPCNEGAVLEQTSNTPNPKPDPDPNPILAQGATLEYSRQLGALPPAVLSRLATDGGGSRVLEAHQVCYVTGTKI